MAAEKLKTVIVDDDPLNIIDLKEYLLPHLDRIEITGEFQDGDKACGYINTAKPDLAFLDIEMPGLNGFQMLAELDYSPIVVFITAHAKFALESYDYSPADFLLKPVEPKKLKRAIDNAFDDTITLNNEQRLSNQQRVSGHLPVKYKDSLDITRYPFILPDDILYLRTSADDSHYIEILTADGNLYGPIRQSLSQIKSLLDQHLFIYIYKNMIANRSRFMELIDNKFLVLKGKNNIQVEVSRRYKKAVKQSMNH